MLRAPPKSAENVRSDDAVDHYGNQPPAPWSESDPASALRRDAPNSLAFRRSGIRFAEQSMDLVYGVFDFQIEIALSKLRGRAPRVSRDSVINLVLALLTRGRHRIADRGRK